MSCNLRIDTVSEGNRPRWVPLSLYGTESQFFDAPYQWRWPNGFLCPHLDLEAGSPESYLINLDSKRYRV